MTPRSKIQRANIAELTGEQVQTVIKKITFIQQYLGISLGKSPVYDLQSGLTEEKGKCKGKHIAQHSSLIAHLHRLNLFCVNDQCCFVEFGSGVGRFSDQLQEETNSLHLHLMIDKAEFKRTRLRDRAMQKRYQEKLKSNLLLKGSSFQNSLENNNCSSEHRAIERLTLDVKDLDLCEAILNHFGEDGLRSPVIGVSKHLCGAAFDIALSCMQTYGLRQQQLPAVCMAPCCHSLCHWDHCFYPAFFSSFDFTKEDFAVLCAISQWGTLASDTSTLENTSNDSKKISESESELILRPEMLYKILDTKIFDSDIHNVNCADNRTCIEVIEPPLGHEQSHLLSLSGVEFEKTLTLQHKRALGKICKECIDVGRGFGLLAAGFSEVRLIRYTTSSVENLLICGKP